MGEMAKFFLIGCQVNEIELKELLLRRYGQYKFVNEMPFDEYVSFVVLAITNENREKVYREYLAWLPLLILKGKYMTFDRFYDEITGKNIDFRPAEEILKESEDIEKRLLHGNGVV